MKRIVLDQGLAPRTAEILRADGWDAIHVIEAGLERAEDAAILDFARASDRTCVTLDHDFHAHLALAGSGRPSVVLIRVEKLGPDEQAAVAGLHRIEVALRLERARQARGVGRAAEQGIAS